MNSYFWILIWPYFAAQDLSCFSLIFTKIGAFWKPLPMVCQKMRSEFCCFAPFWLRIRFCISGCGQRTEWKTSHRASGVLSFRHPQSPVWKNAEKNGGSDSCRETTHIIMVPLYPSFMSFAGKKRNYANVGANLNLKIVWWGLMFFESIEMKSGRIVVTCHGNHAFLIEQKSTFRAYNNGD